MNIKPIRILCVFGALNKGGSETMCMNLFRHIDRTRIAFDFVKHTSKKCAYEDEIIKLGGKIYEAPKLNIYNILQYIVWWIKFFKRHKEHKIVHGHYFTISAIYLFIAKLFGCYAIAHAHIAGGHGINKYLQLIAEYPIRYIADYFFACSDDAGKWVFGNNIIHKNNYKVLKNAIEVKCFGYDKIIRKKYRNIFNISDETLVYINVGRLCKQKNHIFLLDLFARLHKQNKNNILFLIGVGELENEIKKKIQKLGLSDSVILLGTRSDIPQLLQMADCFLFPSLYEGLGIVAIEAQSTGIKCLCSEFVPKEVGVTDLCKFIPLKLDLWLKEAMDINLSNRESKQKQLIEAGYNIGQTSKEITDFYQNIIIKEM